MSFEETVRDDALHRWAADALGGGSWAVATIEPGATRVAVQGIDPGDDLEIGSISKGLTALLLTDAVERGEMLLTDRLDTFLPLDGSPAGLVTLDALSRHRSGLPSLPAQAHMGRRTASWLLLATNPYGDTLAELLEQTRATKVGRPRPVYSNLGFQLLGHAVAAAAGRPYRDLLAERLLGPLGLTSASVPATPDELGQRAVVGRTRWGRRAEPWTGEALGPAGGVRMSVRDAATLARALLEGSAPGTAALEPVDDFVPGARIGAAWITSPHDGVDVTWHNGGTGGFRTWLGLDRSAGTAAVVLNARVRSVDAVGRRLLATLRT